GLACARAVVRGRPARAERRPARRGGLVRAPPADGSRKDLRRRCLSRYVVTGAAGFIGSHLTESLLAEGHGVLAVDSFTDYYDAARKEENAAAFDVVRADLAEAPLGELF